MPFFVVSFVFETSVKNDTLGRADVVKFFHRLECFWVKWGRSVTSR